MIKQIPIMDYNYIAKLDEIEKNDLKAESGKLFAYIYETGEEEIKEIANTALLKFYNKNVLDFTVFRSAVFFERELVNFSKNLMNAPEGAVGSYTYGGTESIMLAVKAARDYYRKKHGNSVCELVVPVTIHPSFYKAADYLGLRVKRVGIDEDKKVDVEQLKEAVSDKTALIAVSAPNWPYGTVDPVKEVAEFAADSNVLLHVDACLGGYILPFLERLGENVPEYDFRVEGVTSMSMDLHKYGYTPKGASILLFRNAELKKCSMYVDVSSPGYIFVNTAVLSSRSVGPMAAAYSVVDYLGIDGYLRLAEKVLKARNEIYRGLKELGFDSIAPVESSVLCMSGEIDLFNFVVNMRELGWHFHLQKGLKDYNIPPNIHLTISPIHERTAKAFVEDAKKAVSKPGKVSLEEIVKSIMGGEFSQVIEDFKEGKIDSSVVPMLLENLPEEFAVEIVKELVIEWYS